MKNKALNLSLWCFTFSLIVLFSNSEAGIQWDKTYGGEDGDWGNYVIQTNDGGYMIAAGTCSYGDPYGDAWIIKIDSEGDEEWSKTYGGSGGDGAGEIKPTNDGGYIIFGTTSSYGAGNYDFWLIKIDSEGNEEWSKTFGGSDEDGCVAGLQASDGGYIMVGDTKSFGAGNYDVWLVKADSEGNMEWNKTFGTSKAEQGRDVCQSNDGGYAITGSCPDSVTSDMWLIKTDSYGNKIWDKTYDYANNGSHDWGESIKQKEDGGYIICGITTYPANTENKACLVSTDASGNMLWSRIPSGGIGATFAVSVELTNDSGFFIVGYSNYYDVLIIKTNSEGYTQWSKLLGEPGVDKWDRGYFGFQLDDWSYIIIGDTQSYGAGDFDVWLINYTPYDAPISCTEILMCTLILLLLASCLIVFKKKRNFLNLS